MLKPPMPGMTDTLEFVKNLWGGMQIPGAMPGMPGMSSPAMSVEDLDKKIADLKAVEAWLNLNLGMLRGTIQTLEIQRGTLATLKTMGDNMARAMNQTGAASDAATAPFAQFFAQAAQAANAPKPAPAEPQPAPQPDAQPEASNAGMPAAIAWWNLLQDQFRQAVVSAMPGDGGAPQAEPPSDAAKQAAGSPLDVSGGAPAPGAGPGDGAGNGVPGGAQGGPATGRRTARGKTDKA